VIISNLSRIIKTGIDAQCVYDYFWKHAIVIANIKILQDQLITAFPYYGAFTSRLAIIIVPREKIDFPCSPKALDYSSKLLELLKKFSLQDATICLFPYEEITIDLMVVNSTDTEVFSCYAEAMADRAEEKRTIPSYVTIMDCNLTQLRELIIENEQKETVVEVAFVKFPLEPNMGKFIESRFRSRSSGTGLHKGTTFVYIIIPYRVEGKGKMMLSINHRELYNRFPHYKCLDVRTYDERIDRLVVYPIGQRGRKSATRYVMHNYDQYSFNMPLGNKMNEDAYETLRNVYVDESGRQLCEIHQRKK